MAETHSTEDYLRFLNTSLSANLEASRQPETRRAYATAWERFREAARRAGECCLPAEPHFVAAYLSALGESVRPGTVRLAASAIAAVHRDAGELSPCDHEGVRQALAGNERRHGADQRQARGLTKEVFDAIRMTACVPRRTRGGRTETPREAYRRGMFDIALIGAMRDGLLRRSEAAALVWGDIVPWEDGTGRMTIRRSKTDQAGEGFTAFLSADTMRALGTIRQPEHTQWHRVFGLSASQVYRRLKAACAAAGHKEGFSGHSARVGMSQDLVHAGESLPGLMQVGRWANPRMPARYTEREQAGRNAVARWYEAEWKPLADAIAACEEDGA